MNLHRNITLISIAVYDTIKKFAIISKSALRVFNDFTTKNEIKTSMLYNRYLNCISSRFDFKHVFNKNIFGTASFIVCNLHTYFQD